MHLHPGNRPEMQHEKQSVTDKEVERDGHN